MPRPTLPTAILLTAWASVGCEPASTLTPARHGSTAPDHDSASPEQFPAAEVNSGALDAMAAPSLEASPAGATFVDAIEVTLTASDPDATIWYTTDGRPPEIGVSTPYTGPITLTTSAELRALAELHGGSLVVHTAKAFLRLDATVDGFASDLPLLVMWSRVTAPEWKEEAYEPFTLTAFEPLPGGEVTWPAHATTSVRSGLKIRGSSSSGYPKHPYRIEAWDPAGPDGADLDVPLLGMPADADWVLLAPLDFDRALVRDALMYQLSNDIGRYAARTRFVELFVADESETLGLDDYQGVYVVIERLERGVDRIDVTRLEPTDLAAPLVTGGYIFKEDRTGPDEAGFTAGTAGGVFTFEQPFVAVEPVEQALRPEQFAYLTGELDALGSALASVDLVDPLSGRHYEDIIDVDAWIDHHILQVFAKNPDSFRLSGYFHKDRLGLLAAGPVWDFDRTMGCATDTRALNPTWWDASNETTDLTLVFEHGFWEGLFRDPVFRDRYWARWAELLVTDLSVGSVHATIDAMAAELTEAAPRNFAAWPDYPPRGGSLESEIALLKDWVAIRHAWIEGCLALPDPRACPGT